MIIKNEKFMSEIIKDRLPDLKYSILSGPSFAEEMLQNNPTLATLAC